MDIVQPGDRTLLIVENDLGFARLLVDAARDAGFKTLVTSFGAAALALAREYRPSAITLDISLPDIDGWRVLERLKKDLDSRHIPVIVITTGEDLERGRVLGAASVLRKPIRTREDLLATLEHLRDSSSGRRRISSSSIRTRRRGRPCPPSSPRTDVHVVARAEPVHGR